MIDLIPRKMANGLSLFHLKLIQSVRYMRLEHILTWFGGVCRMSTVINTKLRWSYSDLVWWGVSDVDRHLRKIEMVKCEVVVKCEEVRNYLSMCKAKVIWMSATRKARLPVLSWSEQQRQRQLPTQQNNSPFVSGLHPESCIATHGPICTWSTVDW